MVVGSVVVSSATHGFVVCVWIVGKGLGVAYVLGGADAIASSSYVFACVFACVVITF